MRARHPVAFHVASLLLLAAPLYAQVAPARDIPRDVQEQRRLDQPSPRAEPASADAILRRLRLTTADIERRKADRSVRPVAAPVDTPSDVAAFRRLTAGRRDTAPRGQPPRIDRPGGPRADLEPDSVLTVTPVQGTPMRVTRGAPYVTVAGLGSLSATAYFPYTANSDPNWGLFYRVSSTSTAYSPVGAGYDVKPYLSMTISVTAPGWYVINVSAGAAAAQVRRYVTGTGYTLVQSFTKPTTAGYHLYPVLINLAAGTHYFTWTNTDSYVYVSEVYVMKL